MRTFRAVRILILVTCCVSCSQPVQQTRIHVGYLPMVSSLAYFVAVENKYFVDADIQIDGAPIETSNLIANDLAMGALNAAIELSVVPLLQTIEGHHVPFRIFSTSSITHENGFDGVVVREDSTATSLRDLSGKRVGVFPGSTARASFESVFAKLFPGVPPPEFKTISPKLHLQSLASGEIDALHAYEPTLTLCLVGNHCRLLHASIYAEQQSPNPIGVAAVNAKWYAENKEVAGRFFVALDRAALYIKESPVDARRILSKYTKADPSVAAQMHIMPMSTSDSIDKTGLAAYIEILRGIGEVTSPIPVESLFVSR